MKPRVPRYHPKPRIPRYYPDQKRYLSSIESYTLKWAEEAGEEYVLLQTKTLKWLLSVAQRAPYPVGGRPPKVPGWELDFEISEGRKEIAEIKAKHKQAGKAPEGKRTSELISDIIRRIAAETGYSEGYIENLLKHPKRRRKKKIANRATSGS